MTETGSILDASLMPASSHSASFQVFGEEKKFCSKRPARVELPVSS